MTTEPTMSINVRSVPVSLWRKAKAQAALEGKTLNAWLIEVLTDRLENEKK